IVQFRSAASERLKPSLISGVPSTYPPPCMCRKAGRFVAVPCVGGVYTNTRTSGASAGPGTNRCSQLTACCSGESGNGVAHSVTGPRAGRAPNTSSLKSIGGTIPRPASSSGATSPRVPLGPWLDPPDSLFPLISAPLNDPPQQAEPGAAPGSVLINNG